MSVDFTDLSIIQGLPRIDHLVDSTTGHELLSFLDTYGGYNQICMYEVDKPNTASITKRETYCYRVMPFGLKTIGATSSMYEFNKPNTTFITKRETNYYRVMPFGLKTVGETFIIWLIRFSTLSLGKQQKFTQMRCWSRCLNEKITLLIFGTTLKCQYQMKLNTKKCMFGVASEKFLGYLVTQHGIETNPDQMLQL